MKDKQHILLLDNYDSFTYNLYDYLEQLGLVCTVIRNDQITIEEIENGHFDGIVFSPGPQRPENAGQLMPILTYFYTKMPILGICLGMQAIGTFFGAELVHASVPVHGKTSMIEHTGKQLFQGITLPTQVMRYHSLLLKELPSCLQTIAWTDQKEVMAIVHESLPVWGVQFHPESILTLEGLAILDNWIQQCLR